LWGEKTGAEKSMSFTILSTLRQFPHTHRPPRPVRLEKAPTAIDVIGLNPICLAETKNKKRTRRNR
jgi:hypothetical protein